jgi:hypothetical protein
LGDKKGGMKKRKKIDLRYKGAREILIPYMASQQAHKGQQYNSSRCRLAGAI